MIETVSPLLTETELAYLDGDDSRFREVYEEHHDFVFSAIYDRVRNVHDAEELTQDVFLRFQKYRDSFRRECKLCAWLRRIAGNLMINRYQYWQRRHRKAWVSWDAPIKEGSEISIADYVISESDTVNKVVEVEILDSVRDSLRYLSPQHQSLLQMRLVENKRYDQIAVELNMSLGTVKSGLCRARERLKGLVKRPANQRKKQRTYKRARRL